MEIPDSLLFWIVLKTLEVLEDDKQIPRTELEDRVNSLIPDIKKDFYVGYEEYLEE